MTVTIYIWRAEYRDPTRHDAALLHQYEDAQPALYDLPDGWAVEQNEAGQEMICNDRGEGCELIVQGSGVAAVSSAGIVWLHRIGEKRGDALKLARESAGLSMRQLAEKAGVSANTVSLIENGQSNPRADVLAALAKALGTTMDAIWQ